MDGTGGMMETFGATGARKLSWWGRVQAEYLKSSTNKHQRGRAILPPDQNPQIEGQVGTQAK